jgi:hypothetical protein
MKAFVLAGLAMLIPAGAPAMADTTGSLTGRVRDASGWPVAGAIVRVSSPSEVMQTTSDANGRYCFVGLVPETYELTVDKPGYAQGMYVGIAVLAGNQTIANAVLNLRLIGWITHYDIAGTVNPHQTADVYAIGRWNSLLEMSRTIGEVLPFVPGVQVIGGSPYPR